MTKARGVKLGNPNEAAAFERTGKGGAALRKSVAGSTDQHAADLAPVFAADIRAAGHLTLRTIARER